MSLDNAQSSSSIIFIIVNYNGSKDTISCIDSIASQDVVNCRIDVVIVDNNSETADIDRIKQHCEEFEWVSCIVSDKNLGYFPAFNLAIDMYREKIIKEGYSVILCNNDLLFNTDFISTYLSKEYSPKTLVVSPNVITLDGRHQNPHVIKRFTALDKFMLKLYFTNYSFSVFLRLISRVVRKPFRSKKKYKSQFIYLGIGACYILLPRFFEKNVKLDDRVFLGGEEVLIANQIITSGGKNYYDEDVIVIHAEGVTFSKNTDRWRYEQSKKSHVVYKDLL